MLFSASWYPGFDSSDKLSLLVKVGLARQHCGIVICVKFEGVN